MNFLCLFCMQKSGRNPGWKSKKHINNEQKNPIFYLAFVADGGCFSCLCTAEKRHDLHVPLRATEGHVLCAMERQWPGTRASFGVH